MAYTSVTNTFTNGTNTDGPQVNTNFADVLAGLSDGSKDLNMNIATFAGTVTMNGAVTLGNATNDDITFNGSLASSIPIKTTHTYDFGTATVGVRDVFFGSSAGAFTTQLRGADVAASKTIDLFGHDITLPTVDGTKDGSVLMTDSAGASRWADTGPKTASNYSITATVAANALTITLKGSDGNSLSATNAAAFAFRNATIATGQYDLVKATSNLSVVISSGSTLGHLGNYDEEIYLYVFNDGGTLRLGASSTLFTNEDIVHSSTAEGGAGGADGRGTIYTTTGVTTKALRFIGTMKIAQVTAGTWLLAPSNIYCGIERDTDRTFLRYDQNVTQTIASGSAVVIDYERRRRSRGGIWFDDSVNARYYVGESGYYYIKASLRIVDAGDFDAGEFAEMLVNVSNPGISTCVLDYKMMQASPANMVTMLNGNTTCWVEAGAYIYITVEHDSGANMTTGNSNGNYNQLVIRRVG